MILQNPVWIILSLGALPLIYNAYVDKRKKSRIVSLSYALLVIIIAAAATSPAVKTDGETQRIQELIFLDDNSRSMVMSDENISLDGVRINEKVIASGNSSSIARSMMAALEPNKTYLVSSDLRSSGDLQEVVDAYRNQNSTINFLDREMNKESSVAMTGPELTVPNAENRYYIQTYTTNGEKPTPEVTIDGESKRLQQENGETFIEHRFREKGYHRIKVEIGASDRYENNNVYYKTVKVIEKPKVLFVGQRGDLGGKIEEYFNVEYRSRLPGDLEKYYTVILKKKTPEENLKPYLADGNGMIFTGDSEMDVLPVKKAEVTSGTQNPKIIIGIDSSEGALQGTQGWGECRVGDSIKQSKVVANSIVKSQAENNPASIVGVFAYNNSVYSFGSPRPLTDDSYRNKLLGARGIGSIPVCGTAYHVKALRGAKDMIGGSPGNIILVTDGNVPPDGGIYGPSGYERSSSSIDPSEYRRRAIQEARQLGNDVNLHVVGVGNYDSDFIEKLAEAGGGEAYNSPEEFFRQNKTLQGGGGDDLKGINIAENDHFITRAFDSVIVSTSGFDDVKAKDSAEVLLSTSNDRPFLTTWRYGLGRVAAFSGGKKDLQRIVNREPRIVSRTLSWAVGNPQRKDQKSVTVESGRMGQEVILKASYPAKGFIKTGQDEYRATVRPEDTGFHTYIDHQFAYNYRNEIQKLGYRRDLMEGIADRTGGQILKPYEITELRSQLRYENSSSVERVSLTPYILVLALVIFLAQVGYRKMNGWM